MPQVHRRLPLAAFLAGSLLPLPAAGAADRPRLPDEVGEPLVLECEAMEPSGAEVQVRPDPEAGGQVVILGGVGSEVRACVLAADGIYQIDLFAAGPDEKHDAVILKAGGAQIRIAVPWSPGTLAGRKTRILAWFHGFAGEEIFLVLRAAEPGVRVDRLVVHRVPLTPEGFTEREAQERRIVGSESSMAEERFLRVTNDRGPRAPRPLPVFAAADGLLEAEAEGFHRAGPGIESWAYLAASGERVIRVESRSGGILSALLNLPAGIYRLRVEGCCDEYDTLGRLEVQVGGRSAGLVLEPDTVQDGANALYLGCPRDGDYRIALQAPRKPLVLDRIVLEPADLTAEEFAGAIAAAAARAGAGGPAALGDPRPGEPDAYLSAEPEQPD